MGVNPAAAVCTATAKRTKRRCTNPALRGGTVCQDHGGRAPQVRRRAQIRAAVMDWDLDFVRVDPVDQFERMLAVTAHRQAELQLLIAALAVQDDAVAAGAEDETNLPPLPEDYRRTIAAYVGVKVGEGGQREEQLRVLAAAERAERELCAKLAAQAIAAGLDERKVRVLERQATVLVDLFDQFMRGLGLTADQARRAPEVAARVLRAVGGPAPAVIEA